MERLLARALAIAMIAVLAFLTLAVAMQHGIDALVIVAFVVLAILALGVIGALGSPDE